MQNFQTPLEVSRTFADHFNTAQKRARLLFNGPSQANDAPSQPINETVTRVIPYQSKDWSHQIESDSCVFIASPNRNLTSSGTPRYDDKFMLSFVYMNLVLHQTSLTETTFPINDAGNVRPRLPELDDLHCLWRYRGINQTPKSQDMQLGLMKQSRDIVAWFRGDTPVLNYWGNVPGNTMLYFVLMKVEIAPDVTYVLSDTVAVSLHNKVRDDRTGAIKYAAQPGKKMVYRWVPMYPGGPTPSNPNGSNPLDVGRTLSSEQLMYKDLDDGSKMKRGIPVCVGMCVRNTEYVASTKSVQNYFERICTNNLFLYDQPKIDVYAYSYCF
jgi:hypothetical protein